MPNIDFAQNCSHHHESFFIRSYFFEEGGKGVSLSSVLGCCSGRGVGFWGQFSALNCPQKNFCVGCVTGAGAVFHKRLRSSRRRVYRGQAPSYLSPVTKGGVRTTIEDATSLIWNPVQYMHTRPKHNPEIDWDRVHMSTVNIHKTTYRHHIISHIPHFFKY